MIDIPFGIKIHSICAGGWHSAFLDEQSNCYFWGWNFNGQVSFQDVENDSVFVVKPEKLEIFKDFSEEIVKFKSVSLGSRHSALIDIENNLFTFGWNKYEQLFIESDLIKNVNLEKPVRIEKFNSQITNVKCGCWFTAISFD